MSESTLDLVRRALAKAAPDLAKSSTFVQPGTATVGLQSYDLEAPAKNLYPVLTPLRNRIARVKGNGGIQSNWKAITAINTGQVFAGVAEGRRGQMTNIATADYNAAYRTIGMESAASFESELAGEGFDDIRARAVMTLLQSMMIEEEAIILGSNTTLQLGTTATPSLTASSTGGGIAASTTVSVICVAMSYDAYRRIAAQTLSVNTALTPTVTVTPTDGMGSYTTGAGFANKSAAANVATGAGSSANSIAAIVTPGRGTFGYAWFWGAIGSEVLGAVTSTAFTTITTAAGITTVPASAFNSDNSTSSLVFDGLLSIAANPNYNGYWSANPANTGLTGDGAAGIVQFDTLLQHMWDVWRLQPNRMIVSSQEMLNMRRKIAGVGGASAAVRFVFPVGVGQQLTGGGGQPTGYKSPFNMTGSASDIAIELHPNMPPGTVLFTTDTLPYPANGVDATMKIRCRRDYHQLEWPLRSRLYEYGVYSDEVLQHYAPFSMGIITNIANA